MLPTSQNNAPINAHLRPLQQFEAPKTELLAQAFREGLLTTDDLIQRMTIKPLQEKVERAAAKDALSQLEIAPARRQQEMTQAEQAARLRDLQINAQTQDLADAPARREGAAKLQGLQIKQAEQSLADAQNPVGAIQRKTEGEQIAAFIRTNPGTPIPRGTDGKVDMAAVASATKTVTEKETAKAEQKEATSKTRDALAEQYVKTFKKNPPVDAAGNFDTETMSKELQTAAVTDKKAVTQTELKGIEAVTQADADLAGIEKIFAGIDKSGSPTGPVAGRIRGLNPYDNESKLMEQAINAAVPNLARGVFREVGVLTDEDVKRYKNLFPTLNDPADIRQEKLQFLRNKLAEAKQNNLDSLAGAGRDVSAFKKGGAAATPVPSGPTAENPAGAPEVNSQEAYDALAPGAQYRYPGDPAGKFRSKAGVAVKAAPLLQPEVSATVNPKDALQKRMLDQRRKLRGDPANG